MGHAFDRECFGLIFTFLCAVYSGLLARLRRAAGACGGIKFGRYPDAGTAGNQPGTLLRVRYLDCKTAGFNFQNLKTPTVAVGFMPRAQ